ncbi:CocE/NonD family hydrolase [Sphingosinicella rhizophila]|uniref:CocE/NonD family hydrolase n=1 Tax=Sphingosinicella rhizophila TaxID=3050082 RepID=A0ABU3QBF7_9SPHN|nr:CocE/NonD family hydrolase [Sphingosinicella sp. GR2756]MDT9600727.1 CocE/NonD family hydrolase [Sphingosinicella sp. GR2756]
MKTLHILVCALLALAPIAAVQAKDGPAEAGAEIARPQGWSDKSYYLAMKDSTRIAISLYWPGGQPPSAPAPAILFQTRYGRAGHFSNKAGGDPQRWRDAGYVVAVIDTRGSTASFGPRDVDIGPDEVADMDAIIAHLAGQSWSNGEVIGAGVSYMADTADWATSRAAPALIAAVPRQADFDAWAHLFFPGGVRNDYMLSGWGSYTREIDLGRDGRDRGLDCRLRVGDCPELFPILQPVDEDSDYDLVRAALSGRRHWGPDDYRATDFRDEPGLNGYSLFDSSPAAALDAIRRERKPVQYWGSWMDGGTAEAALARYRSAPEVPMEIWITGNNHGHQVGADPLLPARRRPVPSEEEQFARNRDFVERVRRGERIGREINYYVLGAGTFRKTASWPPANVSREFLAFTSGNRLSARPAAGIDRTDVDFTATTGKATRWTTQFGTPPDYPDRRNEDRKLLVYDGPPMTQDMELVGTPVVTLHIAARTTDPAFFVYLEDVAPDGRVSYLTEGTFRAIHRKPADPADLPYDQGPAPHSFAKADAMNVVPGKLMRIEFALWPVAARIAKGHRLRVAIGGADADTFRRHSKGQAETFSIHRGGTKASGIAITTRPWTG